MVIHQGDVFWVDLGAPAGSEPGYRHPYVVIQNDAFNRSRINTVVVCALTSNLKLAQAPGNILLEQGEANLPKRSVVNISQLYTVDKRALTEKIGSLSWPNLNKVVESLWQLVDPLPLKGS